MKNFFYWTFVVRYQMFMDRNLLPKLRGHKPLKWGIYVPLLSAKAWGRRLQEMQFGQLVFGKFMFVINFTVLLKVFDAPAWSYPVAFVLITFLMWYGGYLLDKKGVRRHFREAEFKDVKLKAGGIE